MMTMQREMCANILGIAQQEADNVEAFHPDSSSNQDFETQEGASRVSFVSPGINGQYLPTCWVDQRHVGIQILRMERERERESNQKKG
jgi:hypothetical protein